MSLVGSVRRAMAKHKGPSMFVPLRMVARDEREQAGVEQEDLEHSQADLSPNNEEELADAHAGENEGLDLAGGVDRVETHREEENKPELGIMGSVSQHDEVTGPLEEEMERDPSKGCDEEMVTGMKDCPCTEVATREAARDQALQMRTSGNYIYGKEREADPMQLEAEIMHKQARREETCGKPASVELRTMAGEPMLVAPPLMGATETNRAELQAVGVKLMAKGRRRSDAEEEEVLTHTPAEVHKETGSDVPAVDVGRGAIRNGNVAVTDRTTGGAKSEEVIVHHALEKVQIGNQATHALSEVNAAVATTNGQLANGEVRGTPGSMILHAEDEKGVEIQADTSYTSRELSAALIDGAGKVDLNELALTHVRNNEGVLADDAISAGMDAAGVKMVCTAGNSEKAVAEGDDRGIARPTMEIVSRSGNAMLDVEHMELPHSFSRLDEAVRCAATGNGERVEEVVPITEIVHATHNEGGTESLKKLKEENAFLRAQLESIKGKKPMGAPSYAEVVRGTVEGMGLSVSSEGDRRLPSKLLTYYEPKVVEGKRRAVIPTATIQQGRTKWVSTLVGFFVNGRPPIPVVMKEAWRRWKEKGLQKVVANDNDYFFFTFKEESAMRGIFEEEVAVFLGHTMIIQPWEEGDSYKKKHRMEIPKWCKLSNIPFEMWTEEGLSHIASLLGRPLCLDTQTARLERMSYARVCIMIQQNKEVEEEVEVETEDGQRIYVVKVETQKWYRPMPPTTPQEPSRKDPCYMPQPVEVGDVQAKAGQKAKRPKRMKKVWRPKAPQVIQQGEKEFKQGPGKRDHGDEPERVAVGEADVDPQLDAILQTRKHSDQEWRTIPMKRGSHSQFDLSNKRNVVIVHGVTHECYKEPLSTPMSSPND